MTNKEAISELKAINLSRAEQYLDKKQIEAIAHAISVLTNMDNVARHVEPHNELI